MFDIAFDILLGKRGVVAELRKLRKNAISHLFVTHWWVKRVTNGGHRSGIHPRCPAKPFSVAGLAGLEGCFGGRHKLVAPRSRTWRGGVAARPVILGEYDR